MNDQAITDILDRLRNRFYGKYRGTVTQVDAPTMRIKAKVPSVLADQESSWCVACVPYAGKQVGFAFLPEVERACGSNSKLGMFRIRSGRAVIGAPARHRPTRHLA
jgi:hypothetical protein